MPAFDRRIGDFEAVNTQVLGISTDSPFSHDNWAKSVGISHYPLLSDIHRTVQGLRRLLAGVERERARDLHPGQAGKIRFIERYDRGQLPYPDRMLAEVKKLS